MHERAVQRVGRDTVGVGTGEGFQLGFLGFHGLSRAGELDPLDDHLLPLREARFHDRQPLVDVQDLDDGQLDVVLIVNNQHARAFLGLDDGRVGDDQPAGVIADGELDLHVLAGQDELPLGWAPRP